MAGSLQESKFMVMMKLRERESVQEAVRRFRKIVERSGLKREMRRREYYEKPSDVKRKARNRAIRRAQRSLKRGRKSASQCLEHDRSHQRDLRNDQTRTPTVFTSWGFRVCITASRMVVARRVSENNDESTSEQWRALPLT